MRPEPENVIEVLGPMDHGTAIVMRVLPISIRASWTCRVCHRAYGHTNAMIFWDGTSFLGLICPSHPVEEIESALVPLPKAAN